MDVPDNDCCIAYFSADDRGKHWYFVINTKETTPAERSTFIKHNTNGSLTVSKDGSRSSVHGAALHHPNEVMVAIDTDVNWDLHNASKANEKLLKELDMPLPESVNVVGAGGTPMQMWILKPPGFDEKKKRPPVYLAHGGRKGAWEDGWSFRWEPASLGRPRAK